MPEKSRQRWFFWGAVAFVAYLLLRPQVAAAGEAPGLGFGAPIYEFQGSTVTGFPPPVTRMGGC